MVQRVIHVDDLDGSEGAKPVFFGLNGSAYEIDLSPHNEERLRSVLKEFVDAARLADVSGSRRVSASAAPRRNDLDEVRSWARENGFEVSDRGRIAANIIAAFDSRNVSQVGVNNDDDSAQNAGSSVFSAPAHGYGN